MVIVGVCGANHSALTRDYPPLRQHQGHALRVRAPPAALTLPALRVFCLHTEWFVVRTLRPSPKAPTGPGKVRAPH